VSGRECGHVYGTGQPPGWATCRRSAGHPLFGVDGIGHSSDPEWLLTRRAEEAAMERELVVTLADGTAAKLAVEVSEDEVTAYKLAHGRPEGWGGMDPWERDGRYDVAGRVALEKIRRALAAEPSLSEGGATP
jgi:hypothetical protein